jgi:tetratricopeptide (TPR) repeat protein
MAAATQALRAQQLEAVAAAEELAAWLARPAEAPPVPRTPAALRAEGNEAFGGGEYARAVELYTRAAEAAAAAAVDGGSGEAALALSNRSLARLKLKDWRAAADDATAALRLDPTFVKSWERRAAARNALGQHAGAAADLRLAAALVDPAAAAVGGAIARELAQATALAAAAIARRGDPAHWEPVGVAATAAAAAGAAGGRQEAVNRAERRGREQLAAVAVEMPRAVC